MANKFEKDLAKLLDVLSKAPNGLLLVPCATKAKISIEDARYVLACLVEEDIVEEQVNGKLKYSIYRLKEK